MPKPKTYTKKTDIEKPWNKKKKASQYAINTIVMRKTFLIVCEGQTEKCYFESFPVRTVKVEIVNLEGQSKLKLVECTQEMVCSEEYDEVWCVFDMDVNIGEDEFQAFDNAIHKAHSLNFKVAYSNDAFELWFYLHYNYTDTAQRRSFYYDQLSNYWGINYVDEGKRYSFCTGIYDKLKKDDRASQQNAIDRAETLFTGQQDKPFHEQNPVTTVYRLVISLNKHILDGCG
ncbi:MAG: RloB family protein [Bacteroidales bacterium]|jgi:hypothetical protein|nr:RloB family protein [Bacteroidales bacterium]NLB03427.1 RloB domain-containing protein [Bacteroidales bacterium]